jgi:transposase
VLEAVQQRLDENPKAMRVRRKTVEHPFGTMKARMGATHFLMKTLPKVATEMALSVLAYNLTRVMNIVGVKPQCQSDRFSPGARVKTDRIDTGMLLRAFSAWLRGEPDACRMVAIPTREEEDLRRPSRERAELVTERTRLRNRIRALLTLHGLSEVNPNTPATCRKLAQLRTAEDEPLPPNARAELERLFERFALIKKQIKGVEAAYGRHTAENMRGAGEHDLAAQAQRFFQQLVTVTGMGAATATLLVAEVFMRRFADRRALARFVGLTGTPDESGSRRRDRGLMKAGSARVRHVMIQLAWRMLYHQPNATLVQWYRDRVAKANGAGRKTFIVALARSVLQTHTERSSI